MPPLLEICLYNPSFLLNGAVLSNEFGDFQHKESHTTPGLALFLRRHSLFEISTHSESMHNSFSLLSAPLSSYVCALKISVIMKGMKCTVGAVLGDMDC